MISIIVDIHLKENLLEVFWPEENNTWILWVIQYDITEDKVIISCIDWKSRDDLFELLTKTLIPSVQ